ncbi:hypothetical protein JI435_091840 [Parastagonospora nodorum SN15]|uniref:Uncharacterized protein n=1 Tax=Phaeosphaeria nodorum (strain SN15 / ATCC MYA-4574 / FGSC 10173) TaxID=321614 RepID=A0A7U2I3P6_PHANO|nr:hypothetical protein JI435_091840 [Parastagonospora nodorum SN15]
MAATTIRELGARHGLSNLSVHDLVEEFARHVSSQVQEKKIQDQNPNSNISDTATGKTRIKARARLIERQRLESEAQLRKASEEEELAKTKKEKREKEAREREAGSDGPLDSDDYRSDSSPDIDPEDDSEDEEATTAKDLAREQKERLKALLNAKYNEGQSLRESRDGNGTLHSGRNKRTMKLPARWGGYCDSTPYQLTGAYILYFKELSSDNGRIFASVMGMTRTRAMVLSAIIGHVHFKN